MLPIFPLKPINYRFSVLLALDRQIEAHQHRYGYTNK